MFGSIGPTELLLIFLVVLLVFGADRLPELAKGLGKGMREFRRAADEVKSEIIGPENDVLADLKHELEDEANTTKEMIEDDYPENAHEGIQTEVDTQEIQEQNSGKKEEDISAPKKADDSSELAG